MREIKFRAKRQDNGEWIRSGTLVSFHSGDTTDFFLPKSPSHCDAWADQDGNLTVMESSYYRVQADTLGQFTGLTDKNGVKIFEGDIVEYEGKRYSINYLPHYARFSAVKPNTVFCVFAYQRGEVIGNIYDNPELIGGGENA